ncbi:LysR family transcriptional regulator [Paraliomyxa miuraensis]|uniref:LysR family transcriptional regulator n=1 Tax=Paraliomyxa miuraensis TaxID=376150 RepID=UPI00225B8DF1|nr:LysR family transcriptional regulator [Paraliomyxa miuraensis]MCX4241333.1 LysR family transcriptional regulator [Paraliomyxa miuraensis]
MDLHQLKTFVTVAREGSITRASKLLHLSQPAVSAHIKAMEDTLGLSLFERTPRGMSLTHDGQRLLAKAELTLAAHQELMAEATRSRGELTGKLRIGAGSNSSHEAVGRLLTTLSARFPGVDPTLRHGTSQEILAGLRNGSLDAGFYNEPGQAPPDLDTIEVAEFTIVLVAAPGVVAASDPPDWEAIAALPWIYPTQSACCSRAAQDLFTTHGFQPKRVIGADRQDVTRTLIASGLGVGLLHADTARDAQRKGEVERLLETDTRVRILFACLESRAQDPLLVAASSIMRTRPAD